jgi:serine/threonine protein kinase
MQGNDAVPPQQFPGFDLVEVLGEGSHGTVWLAEQRVPQRRVALKVLRAAFAGPDAQRRFQREVELLGMLEHPRIARLYASGMAASAAGSTPWLAMELVVGRPLLRERLPELTLRRRVEIIEDLCRTLHFAHTRGVVHRDLKPSNVLVDDDGHAHVIDFGVAVQTGADAARMTVAGAVLGTLPYMCPEQLDGQASPDPRWDVYALGAIAYEWLSGRLPHPALATQTSLIAAMRIVSTETAAPLGSVAPATAGDLETVVMKALSPAATRYGSAAEFADDLGRWLEHRPVEARPPGMLRGLHLLMRRHRAAAAGIAATAAILVAATGVSVHFALREANARRDAELRLVERDSINAFLTSMLVSADPEQGAGSDIRVREWLASTHQGYASRADTLPEDVRLSLSRTLGTALLHLGESAQALPLLREAEALSTRRHGAEAGDTLSIRVDAATAIDAATSPGKAEQELREILASAENAGDEAVIARASIALMSVLESQARIDEAYAVSGTAYPRALAALGPDHSETLTAQHNHAALLKYRGDLAAAEPLAREVHQRRNALLGATHPLTLYSANQLGGILDRLGRHAEAETIYRATWEARRTALGDRHPSTLVTLNNLSAALIQQGRLAEAQPLLDELVAATRERFGAEAPRTLMAMNQRAYVLEDLGDLDAAELQLRDVVAALAADPGNLHPERIAPRSNLAMLLSRRGRHDEAIRTIEAVVADTIATVGDQHPYVGIFRSNYGGILADAGRHAAARRELEAAQVLLEAKLGPEHPRTRRNAERLAALPRLGGSA